MNKRIKQLLLYSKLTALVVKIDYSLAKKGFNETFQKVARKYYSVIKVQLDQIDQKKADEIIEIFSALDIICTWYPRKADCIHKTLIGYQLLRHMYDIPVEMVVGIRKFPFEAHAWLINNGDNFFETEMTSQYKIIYHSRNFVLEEANDLVSTHD